MKSLPPTLDKIIEAFSQFPGIGKKTAHRLGLHVLKSRRHDIEQFAHALLDVKNNIRTCTICYHFSEEDMCQICSNKNRDNNIICVCEEPSDIFLLEKTGYMGVYHVLGGLISPLDGIGPDDLTIESLQKRAENASELIIATDANIEGDTTALYISEKLSKLPIKITRLARGVPVGGLLEYVDEATLAKSINDRVEVL